MRVTITKIGDQYSMAVSGTSGPAYRPTLGPGHGELVPHDVAHLLVEVELALTGGVFGRVARRKSSFFQFHDQAEQRRHSRRMKKWKPSPQDRADMAESEQLAGIGTALARRELGHSRAVPDWFSRYPPDIAEDPKVRRVVARLVDFAQAWQRTDDRESLTIDWPDAPRP